jgi:hypothetical protein
MNAVPQLLGGYKLGLGKIHAVVLATFEAMRIVYA